MQAEECDLHVSIFLCPVLRVCFLQQYTLKRRSSTEWKAAEILLLGDFLQRHKVLREIGLEFNIMQSTHCAKNPDKKLLAHHTRDACGAAGLKLKGGRFVPPLFETV